MEDIFWSAVGSLADNDNSLLLLGSWTPFRKAVTSHATNACIREYLRVTSHPPEYTVCKEYLDFIISLIEKLEIPYIFVHSDELVYSKLCDLLWKNQELYKNIILLMGGFHQLRVMQRLIHKLNGCRNFKQLCIDAEVIAAGSSDQALYP